YSPLTRLQILLPIPVAYLAAAGIRTKKTLAAATVAVIAAADLGVFAGRFYPYLETNMAVPPSTPTIAFLQDQPKPFRIAPFFIDLWPNSSELYHLEDIRSHFSSEAKYRQLLHRIDPTSFSGNSTVIMFNSLKFDFNDPLISMLGVRYYLENRDIDIIHWQILKSTIPPRNIINIYSGLIVERALPDTNCFSIVLPISIDVTIGVVPRWIICF